MASILLPQIWGEEVEPSPDIQASLAGQAAANVANRKSQLLGKRLQMSEPQQYAEPQPVQPESQLVPQQPQFMSQQNPTINPNTVIASRPGGVVTMPTGMVVRSQQPTEGEIAANQRVAEETTKLVDTQSTLLEKQAEWMQKKADIQEEMVGIEEQSQARRAQIEQGRSRAMESGLTKLNYLTEEVKNGEIKDYWADKSTGNKVLSAIAVGLGAAAQAFGAGSNPAMQILNQAIEADLVKQKTNLAKGRENLEDQRTLMAETSKIFDNDLVAEEGARVGAYRTVMNKLDVMETQATSDEMRGKVGELKAALGVKLEQAEQAFQQSLRSDVTQQFASKYIAPRTITYGDVMTEQAKQEGAVDYNQMAKDKKMGRFVPVYGGFAYKDEDAQKLREMGAKRETLKTFLKKLIRFRESNKQWDALSPGERAQAQALVTEAQLIKKDVNQLGVLAGPDMELLESGLPNPNALFSFNADRYKAVLNSVKVAERQDIQGRIQPAVNIPKRLRRGGDADTFQAGI